ncbi:hypothetical protein KKA14_19870 [bacterium]|nr:hypothetical protein [bacterium]
MFKNQTNKISLIVFSIICFSLSAEYVHAKIDFKNTSQDTIDLEKLTIDKQVFLSFVASTINSRQAGLGLYGRISFNPCDFEIGSRKLIEYKNLKGIENRFLSNPSCSQSVIRKILENSYKYQKDNLSDYEDRKCVMELEEIFSPVLEYYSIQYEEILLKGCTDCVSKEQNRLEKIINIQRKIVSSCNPEHEKVMLFINDLIELIENTYKTKTSTRRK